MSSLETHIRTLAPSSVRINLWPTETGYQANVSEQSGGAWTVVVRDDPIEAVTEALRQRCTGMALRSVEHNPAPAEPEQIDIEDAIASVDLESLLG